MALVLCAFVMYILWWDKPFDVEHKTIILVPASMKGAVIREIRLEVSAEHRLRIPELPSDALFDIIIAGLGKRAWHKQ